MITIYVHGLSQNFEASKSPELSILFGLLNSTPLEKTPEFRKEYGSRYENKTSIYDYKNVLEYCNKNFEYSDDISKSDIIVFPNKFKGTDDPLYNILVNLANKHKKKIFCFSVNDINKRTDNIKVFYDISENTILYRTDFYLSQKKYNERFMIPSTWDLFSGIYIDNPKLSISFCGDVSVYKRKYYLDILKNSNLNTDFIYRNSFFPGFPLYFQVQGTKEYIDNMSRNIFAFACRGDKNWSYRFFEIFMMGRIPIYINTDCVLPCANDIDYKKQCVFIEENKIEDESYIINKIVNFYEKNKNNLLDIQKQNRLIYEKYFSSIGNLEVIKKDIINNI